MEQNSSGVLVNRNQLMLSAIGCHFFLLTSSFQRIAKCKKRISNVSSISIAMDIESRRIPIGIDAAV